MDLDSGVWAQASQLGYSLTLVAGVTPPAALAAFGADPARLEVLTWQQAVERQVDGGVRAGQLPGWTFCFEYVASRASEPVLTRLSADSEALNVFDGGGKCFVTVYRDGRRVTLFEPGIQAPAATDDLHFARRVTELIQIEHLDRHHAVLEMFTEHVGTHIPAETLEGPLLTALLPAAIPLPPAATPPAPGAQPRRSLGPQIGQLRL